MRQSYKILLPLLGLAIPSLADTPDGGFDRYQVILDRAPFGSLPAPESNAQPIPAAESFAKNLRLSMIIEPDDGPKKIGFVDGRNNRSYSLAEGESEDGIDVVSADFANGEAVLRQGSEMALIKFASGEVTTITPGQLPQTQPQIQPEAPRPSYADRRRMRQQQAEQPIPQPEKPVYTGAELEKHLYEYQMEVIRQGLPPLPIPLTPEQDDQLVREGVLPPQ